MKKTAFLAFVLLMSDLYGQLIPCRVGKHWGYCDTARIVQIRTEFDFAGFFTGDIAFVMNDTVYHGINSKGEIITPALKHYGSFVNGLCPIQLMDGKCFYIDTHGKVAIDMQFSAAENFSEGLAVVSIGKKLGIIDTLGNWVRKPDFDTSSVYFKSGFLLAISRGKYFYINRSGKTLALPDTIQPGGIFSEGLAAVYVTKTRDINGKKEKTTYLEFMDTGRNIVLKHFVHDSFDYSEYLMLEKDFTDGKALVKAKNQIGWDYYFLDRKGRFSPLYSSAKHLGDSLFLGVIGYYMSEVRILDSNYYVAGQFQSKPLQVGVFGDGLLPFCNKEGKWGYMDSNCKIMIKPKYEAAYAFKNGFAYIVLDRLQGIIDTKGYEYFR
jgi:hypothetical protein